MAITLADLPKEVLEQVIAPSYDGQRSQWRTNLLCLKIFHDIALYFQYRSLVMTPVNIACFPLLPQAPPDQHHCAPFHSALRGDEDDMCLRSSHHVQRPSFDDLAGQPPVQTGSLPMIAHSIRHLTLELPGFACAARLRRFCAAPYTHITVDKTKLYVRHADFVAHLNHCLCSLAAQLPKLKMLKSFSIKAYRGRPYYSCTEDRPFLAETTIIRLLRGLRECKELRALDIDLTDAEEIVGSMALEERSCADHSCFVISQTVASLPKLRSISLRKREMCAGCLDFLTVESPPNDADPHDHLGYHRPEPASSLERLVLDLRIPDWQHITSHTYEARVRPCNYVCHCSTCIAKRERVQTTPPTASPPSHNSSQPSPGSGTSPWIDKNLNKLLSDVFPIAQITEAEDQYQPWPAAHTPHHPTYPNTPASLPIVNTATTTTPPNWLPHYHPATPNIHLHWMVQHNTYPTNGTTTAANNSTIPNTPSRTPDDQSRSSNELAARRAQLECFLRPLLTSTARSTEFLRHAHEVKVLVNRHPDAACDNRLRGGVGVDCISGKMIDLQSDHCAKRQE